MAFGTRVFFEEVRELNFGDFGGTYVPIGVPLIHHIRLMALNNSTNHEIYISLDGINDHLRMAQNSFKLFDLSSNKVKDDGLFISSGTQVFIRYVSTIGTSGSVWIEVMYAEGGK